MKRWRTHSMGILRKALLIDAVIFGVAGVLWWFRGEHSGLRLCNILFVLGGIAVFIGSIFVTGVKEGSVCYPCQPSSSASPAGQPGPGRQGPGYPERRRFDYSAFFVAGMIAIGVGAVLYFFCHPMK